MSEIRYILGGIRRLLNPKYLISLQRIHALKNLYKGQRCFIIGNGPSLKFMDLSPLKDELTFGLNRIYLLFDQLGFSTSYYVVVNRLVIEQCAGEIVQQVPCPKFVDWDCQHLIKFTRDMMFLKSFHDAPFFSTDISRGIWQGTTVTYVAMQIAYYMGFEQVILIGVDHNFKQKGEPHKIILSDRDDEDHFDPGYFGNGFRWQLPDLRTSEFAFSLAKFQFESAGREILDATIGGKLTVFPKVDYGKLSAGKVRINSEEC